MLFQRTSLLTALLFLVTLTSAKPRKGRKQCHKPLIRKEWRTLSRKAQTEYLSAVQCFLTKPGITPPEIAPGAVSRYDDLVVTHNTQAMSIHFVGHFLPWHRWYTAIYEKGLREECGYKGAQPYWDWNLDAPPLGSLTTSPLWDSVYGFGGNGPYEPIPAGSPLERFAVPGRTGGGCVTDGPFVNMTVRIGPGADLSGNQARCLTRDFSPSFASRYLGKNMTDITMAPATFGEFIRVVEGGPSFDDSSLHGGGHFGVGGTLGVMGDNANSPGDPVFFLHHANLDRLWWSWQKKNLAQRLTDMSGPIHIMDYNNAEGGNVTLAFPLSVGVNADDVVINDVMHIQRGELCYDYATLYV
ncbi:hypothetical protein BJ165DRAFT_1417209 [Panaeolus papilionaceus]|nr:hypothetical protein BJ165DRAFT_1417209 [Panaeolus papilionaceus]